MWLWNLLTLPDSLWSFWDIIRWVHENVLTVTVTWNQNFFISLFHVQWLLPVHCKFEKFLTVISGSLGNWCAVSCSCSYLPAFLCRCSGQFMCVCVCVTVKVRRGSTHEFHLQYKKLRGLWSFVSLFNQFRFLSFFLKVKSCFADLIINTKYKLTLTFWPIMD